jgi:phosphomannomutase
MRNEKYIKIYADFLGKFLKPQKRLSAIFDCSNGTAGIVLKKIFKNYKLINFIPDGNFPAHGPNPLEKGSLDELCSAVKKHRADLGVIFDADADRVFFVDDLGRFVNPAVVARLLIWHLKPRKAIIDIRIGRLVKNLESQISNLKIIESKVGHYFIKKLMRETKADFAAEYSGHYYFKKFFYADAGILAAIETINAVSKLPYKLSDFIDLLPQYHRSGELNFKVANKENLMKIIEKKYEVGAKIIKLDGLTMEFSDWRFNLRPSNTEPLVRLNIETTSKKILKQKIRELKRIIISS